MDTIIEKLYNHYYTEAMNAGREDIDASVWAYDMALSDIREMDRAELKAYMKAKDIR